MSLPQLFLANWPSRTCHGPGRLLSIMARPRAWEQGDGSVPDLTPLRVDFVAYRSGEIDAATYRTRFDARVAQLYCSGALAPGRLALSTGDRVRDGDTLLCACARAKAAARRCHRAWIAPFLLAAGWVVTLDGRPFTPTST